MLGATADSFIHTFSDWDSKPKLQGFTVWSPFMIRFTGSGLLMLIALHPLLLLLLNPLLLPLALCLLCRGHDPNRHS